MRTFIPNQMNHQDLDTRFVGTPCTSTHSLENNDFLLILIFLLLYLMEKEEKK